MLCYPPDRGISICASDYLCLTPDLYLNDNIIDFYLKYVEVEVLTPEQQERTHIFSQFFYTRLTTVNMEMDPKIPLAQKRHSRVASWTKNINLFEKDFIIVPINMNSHWFLAIICFPYLTEPLTMFTNEPIGQQQAQKRASELTFVERKFIAFRRFLGKRDSFAKAKFTSIGNKTIRFECKNDGERDEAESDDSDQSNMEIDDEGPAYDREQPVKA